MERRAPVILKHEKRWFWHKEPGCDAKHIKLPCMTAFHGFITSNPVGSGSPTSPTRLVAPCRRQQLEFCFCIRSASKVLAEYSSLQEARICRTSPRHSGDNSVDSDSRNLSSLGLLHACCFLSRGQDCATAAKSSFSLLSQDSSSCFKEQKKSDSKLAIKNTTKHQSWKYCC